LMGICNILFILNKLD